MDLGGAVKCIEAAQELGVDRFLIVSSMGTLDIDPDSPMRVYLEAKRDADLALQDSGLRWTIVRPGRADQRSRARAPSRSRRGSTSARSRATTSPPCSTRACRADNTVHGAFDLLNGPDPIENAVLSFTSR